MKRYIKDRLIENLKSYQSESTRKDKYIALEMDLKALIDKHQDSFAEFPGDTYAIIDAVHNVVDGMFQRVK